MLLKVVLLGACAVYLWAPIALAALVASSTVEKCVRSGLEDSIDETCQEKIFTTLTMEGGQSIVTEELQYTMSCIRDIDGEISVTVTKSPVSLLYPITYIRNVNYLPTEEAIYTYTCEDGAHAAIPTCSWLSIDGIIQDDSQGFCCGCTSGSIFDETFAESTERSRAGLNCNWFENPFIPFFSSMPDSAHCLRMNNAWWEMYRIHEARTDFEIVVTVNSTLASNATVGNSTADSNSTVSVLTLTPSRPRGLTEDRRVSAQLLGELAPYIQFPVLTSSKFLIRKAPGQILSVPADEMLVVPDTMVTPDGSECNKIGVGFTAFKYQTQACSRKIASCLDNQPYHLVTEDNDRQAIGLEPIHRAQRYSQAGVVSLSVNFSAPVDDAAKIKYPVASISSSLLSLEVAADSLRFLQNYSPGQIVSAQVCNSAKTVCNSVAALNSASRVMVEVKNIGSLPASYTTTMDNCTYPTIPVPAQSLSLAAQDSADVWFELFMSSSEASPEVNCTIDLFDSQGAVTDTAVLTFSVNATVFESLPDPLPPPALRTTENFSPPAVVECIDKCVCALWYAIKSGLLNSLLCGGSSSGHRHHGSHRGERYRRDSYTESARSRSPRRRSSSSGSDEHVDRKHRRQGRSGKSAADRSHKANRQNQKGSEGRDARARSECHKRGTNRVGASREIISGKRSRSVHGRSTSAMAHRTGRSGKHASRSLRQANQLQRDPDSGTSSDNESLLSQSSSGSSSGSNSGSSIRSSSASESLGRSKSSRMSKSAKSSSRNKEGQAEDSSKKEGRIVTKRVGRDNSDKKASHTQSSSAQQQQKHRRSKFKPRKGQAVTEGFELELAQGKVSKHGWSAKNCSVEVNELEACSELSIDIGHESADAGP